jgi:hypothetical protein
MIEYTFLKKAEMQQVLQEEEFLHSTELSKYRLDRKEVHVVGLGITLKLFFDKLVISI